ncbi:uncharacterized protein LOC127122559 [Lathyrus oleraceus]|uniref:uncharacterized protein LOC127122559 n=1 Tax=Pisum sativum TaxID=3888 RepID=UPI0021D2E6B3|nr:uncharacterized protein LOC127122559 [Pisum sativum]
MAFLKGWEHPVVHDKDGKNTSNLNSEEDWSKEEDELALGNRVDKNIFRLINTYIMVKDAWEILRTTHEGTSKVKISRLQLFNTKFENLRMKDDECIHDFHMNILDIANSSSALGEKMSEEKLVRKILRSLPKKFDMKIITIKEAQEICNVRVDELIGSLQTFELAINDRFGKKNKSITFISNIEDEEDQCDLDTNEGISNATVLPGRQFNKVLKKMDRKSRPEMSRTCHLTSVRTMIIKEKQEQKKSPIKEKVKPMMKLLSMLQLSLAYMNMMKIIVMRMSLMNNWLLPAKSFVSEVKRMYGYPKHPTYTRANHVMIKTRKEWKRKVVVSIFITHTYLRALSRQDQYFDSGYSRHMIGVKRYLADINSYSFCFITFGGGAKGEIKGIGKIGCTGLSRLNDVLLMKGPTANPSALVSYMIKV